MTPVSVALRHIGPMWSSEAASSKQPKRETRPQVGFKPVLPLAAEGKRIEPPVSDPSEPKHRPAAVATPEPLDDAPGPMVPVPGVERRRHIGMMVGERSLGELELAQQDGAGLAQLANDGRIDARDEAAVQGHSRRRGDPFGPAQVLDGDRHAVQLRQELAPPDHLLGRTRLRQRQLRRDERIRLQGRDRRARSGAASPRSARRARPCAPRSGAPAR